MKQVGYDGQDRTMEPVPLEERKAKLGEPGYTPATEETRRRRYQSFFHKNILKRWHPEKDKHRIIAAEIYLAKTEKRDGGYSSASYDGSIPPDHYGPRTFPESRRKAAEWHHACARYVGRNAYWTLNLAVERGKTVVEIWEILGDRPGCPERTARRKGWKLVNDAFDILADFITDGERQ